MSDNKRLKRGTINSFRSRWKFRLSRTYFPPLIYFLLSVILSFSPIFPAWSADTPMKIILIGGKKSHGPGEHDFHRGIKLFKNFLEASPEVRDNKSIAIEAYPYAWPRNEALEEASTLVFYFDGVNAHPLLNANHRKQIDKLMRRGVGLIALHQAFTIPRDDTTIEFQRWLGGARYGMADRTTTSAHFIPRGKHPVSRGISEFTYYDEFYPTIQFNPKDEKLTPILVSNLHVEFADNKPVSTDRSPRTVAWAFERDGGGRSFGFSGGHYVTAWDEPAVRKMLLNAVFWTARLEVPKDGVHTDVDRHASMQLAFPSYMRGLITESVVSRAADNKVLHFPWGRLDWYVSGELGNSDTMTTGLATVLPGKSNPRHFHPDCDEVLHVVQGHIRHTMNERVVEMIAGDTVSIPAGTYHNATNIGTEDAVLAISFSSAWREAVGE